MSLNKSELAIIYYLQTNSKIDNYSKKEFESLIKGKDYPKYLFNEYLYFDLDPDELKPFDEDSLKHYLQMKFKTSFPFSISIFTGQKPILRKTLFWWFTKYSDFDPNNVSIPDESKLNEEQFKLIHNVRTSLIKRKTLLQIINAGPGTGKTTSANALAYSLRLEGVLLISYTNESIRENYKRFFEYPEGKTYIGLKKYLENTINLITVDSLAAKIIGDSSDKNFDETIQLASIRIDPLKFIHPGRGRKYNHIVVDECQDIDDLRGNFLLSFCQKIGIKSLTLCGDPRQKIRENCGKWYSELWENLFDYEKNGHIENNFGPIFRIGFTESYRFRNEKIVDLVNHLSRQRPGLHVELRSIVSKIDPKTRSKTSQPSIHIISLNRLCNLNDLSSLISEDESSCIIGPSIDGDNKTTNIGRNIACLFRQKGYRISFKTEGAFQPDSIPFLTIHAVKGREFDNIFLFGMSNYPSSFSMIPIQEALSLIFVAHSRAIKRIFYIDGSNNGSFTLPLHISPEYVNYSSYEGSVSSAYQDFEKLNTQEMRHFNVTTLVEEHSFMRFLEENKYIVNPDVNCYKSDDWVSMDRPKEISQSLWGFITAFDIQCQLTSYKKVYEYYFGDIMKDNYVILSEDKIVEDILLGKIINNYRVLDNKKVFNHNISKQDISLLLYYYDVSETNLSFVLYLYNKCYNNEDNIILKDIFNNTTSICGSKSLVEVLKGGNIEVSITDSDQKVLHGRSDYLDKDNNVYEFKSSSSSSEEYKSILQTWLYYVMFGNEDSFAYLLDLSKGYLYELSSNESIHRWRYIIRSYFILRHHVDLVTSRRNYYLIYGTEDQKNHLNNLDIKDNLFTVDTEFYNKDIFEIALVNINDPYRTIVDLIRPMSLEGMIFALDWLPDTVTEMYKSSIDKLKMKFNISTSKSKDSPKLGYYIAGMDVDWCLRKDVTKINLSDSARKAAETKGCFLAGSFGPKLGELYTLLAPYPLEYQKHLQAHTALADSLMLYELMILGHLSI